MIEKNCFVACFKANVESFPLRSDASNACAVLRYLLVFQHCKPLPGRSAVPLLDACCAKGHLHPNQTGESNIKGLAWGVWWHALSWQNECRTRALSTPTATTSSGQVSVSV